MKVSEFLGKKVLDKNAVDVGKISDMDIKPKEGKINSLTVSVSEFGLRDKYFEVNINEIDKIGDYLILNIEKTEVEKRIEESFEEAKKSKINPPKVRLKLK